jgi:FkbM family methyltransferase
VAIGLRALRAASLVLGAPPPGLGQHTLARRIYARTLARTPPAEPVVQRMHGGARFELHLSDRVQGEAFLTRRYEPALVDLIQSRLPASDAVVFDAGAHVGLVAIQLATLRRGRGDSIHAFEPCRANVARLRRNLELNPGLSVQLHEVAVGDREAEVTLATAPHGSDLAGTRVVTDAGLDDGPGGRTERAPMITLDGFTEQIGIDRIDVLKLDVEGSEIRALEGAASLMSGQRIGCVVCELNDVYLERQGLRRGDVAARFASWGYREAPVPPVGAQRLRVGRPARVVVDMAFEPGASR